MNDTATTTALQSHSRESVTARVMAAMPPDRAASMAAQMPPAPPPPDLTAIPPTLREARRWLVWRAEGNGAAKPRKVPYYANGQKRQGTLDTAPDLARLASLDTALAALKTGNYTGLGFALGPDDTGMVWQGIDFDALSKRPELAALAESLPGYRETSPSGDGIHAIGYGRPFDSLGSNKTGIEAYAKGRFFTLTGAALGGDIEDVSEFVTAVLKPRHSPERQRPQERVERSQAAPALDADEQTIRDLRSALTAIPADDYATWINVGLALSELGGRGRSLWIEWSQTSDKYSPEDARRWETFKASETGYRAVFAEAARHGWANPAKRERIAPIDVSGLIETARAKQGGRAPETANGPAKTSEPRAAWTDDQKRHARATAARILTADVSPLVEYPIDALGALADPARAMVAGAQVREAMAGQVLLSVAALLAQPLANIRTIDSVKPLSLYCLTIGESGDGKTTADACAQNAIQARQRTDAKTYLEDLRQLEKEPKGRGAERGETPREPYRIARDGTVEGIRRSFVQGVPSQGVFSSEAAAMLAGYGMNADNRAKTAATFNGLWDDGELSVSRGTVGRIQLYDRRLSIHWMLQPDAAYEVMSDPLLSSIGFWPRFLIAWPEPQGPRRASVWGADQSPEIGRFWATCTRLMDMCSPHGWDDCSDLPILNLSDEAMRLACDYFERMEESAKGRIAPLREIKPYAVRSTEQALRIAGVLSIFENPERRIVTAETMRHGIALAAYALETWRGVFGDRDVATARQLALTLYRWLLEQPEGSATLTAMSRIGPKATRPRDRRDTALATLQHARLATESGVVWTAEVPA